jgi:hypothetical protein
MKPIEIESVDDPGNHAEAETAEPALLARHHVPATIEAMLRVLQAKCEAFEYGSTALAAALLDHRSVTLAVQTAQPSENASEPAFWRCVDGTRGIDLIPIQNDSSKVLRTRAAEAEALMGLGGPGDVLIVCDPWGDDDFLCSALRVASYRRVTTVTLTSDHPSVVSALATHAVRVSAPNDRRQEFVAAALRYLVQTAGATLDSNRRRATQPLNAASVL